MNKLKLKNQLSAQLLLIIITITVMFPIVYIFGLSINPDGRRPSELVIFPAQPTLANYAQVLDRPTANPVSFSQLLSNSLMLSTGSAAMSLLIGVFAAYAFSRFKFVGRSFLMSAVLGLTLLPSVAGLLPLFILLNRIRTNAAAVGVAMLVLAILAIVIFGMFLLSRIRNREAGGWTFVFGLGGLLIGALLLYGGIINFAKGAEEEFILRNSLYGVGITMISGGLPFTIWYLKGYLDTIPKELEEAARIDGASFNQTFFLVVLPLAVPVLAIRFFLSFMGDWTEFYISWQFLTDPKDYTLAMTLWNIVGQYAANISWNIFAAYSVVVALPIAIVYAIFQKQIVGGLTLGGVKG